MIGEVIRDILLADADVALLVADRIYPVAMPDAPLFPLLVITKASGVGSYEMQGDAGIERDRIQIDCYSDAGQSALMTLRGAVRSVLTGFSGGTASSPCIIDSCMVISDQDMPTSPFERAGPSHLRRRMLEFNVWNKGL